MADGDDSMSILIQQSSATRVLAFKLRSAADHQTPITGATPTVTISKNGGAFGTPTGAVSEIGSGWYAVAGNATDTNTLGALVLIATAAGADTADREFDIVLADPNVNVTQTGDNFARLGAPAGASVSADVLTANTSLTTLTTRWTAALATNLATTNSTVAGWVTNGIGLTTAAITAVWSALTATLGGYATTTIGYVLAQYTALRAGKLDYLTQSIPTPPTTGQIATAVWTDLLAGTDFSTSSSIGALIKADVNAPIGNIPTTAAPTVAQIATALLTDLLSSADFNTAGSLGALLKTLTVPPTTAQIATALLQDLTSSGDFGTTGSLGALIKANLDTNVGSRLATSGYTAPDNADISSIKLKTDNLPSSPAAVGSAMTLTSAYDAAKTAAQASDIPSANITAIKNKTDNLPLSPSATSDVTGATGTITGAITSAVSTLESNIVPPTAILIREEMDANSTKLAHLQADITSVPAGVGAEMALTSGAIMAIADAIPPPDVSTLATTLQLTSAVTTIDGHTDSAVSGTTSNVAALNNKITIGKQIVTVASPVEVDGVTIHLTRGYSYSTDGLSGVRVDITVPSITGIGLPTNIRSYPHFYIDFPGVKGVTAVPSWDSPVVGAVQFTFALTVDQTNVMTYGTNTYKIYGVLDTEHASGIVVGHCIVN
jgi:hypothetical protein